MSSSLSDAFADLRAHALAGADDDLPAEDKRSRSDVIEPGTEVALPWGQAGVVLCPGRGRAYVCVGWLEGDARNIGTVLLSEMIAGPPAP